MASNDLYKGVLFNDGEGATQGDVNDAQRFLQAKLFDQVFEKLIGGPETADPEFQSLQGANAATHWAYALSIGGGNPRQGSANNKVKIGAGTLFQKIASSTGDEAQLLAYTFDGTDEITLANGHATLNRIDMIQMKLDYVEGDPQSRDFEDGTTHVITTTSMNKKRRVECTLSVVTGVAASSPAYPSPTSGYVPIACVLIGPTYTGANPLNYRDMDVSSGDAVLHDLRMPVHIEGAHHNVPNPTTDFFQVPTSLHKDFTATHTQAASRWTLAASANPIYVPIVFKPGDILVSYLVGVNKVDTTNDITTRFISSSTGSDTNISSGGNSGHVAGNWAVSETTNYQLVEGVQYYIKITPGGTATPGADHIDEVAYTLKHLGTGAISTVRNTTLFVDCPHQKGRLVGLAATSVNGSTTANKVKLGTVLAQQSFTQMSDIAAISETGSTPLRHVLTLAQIEANPSFGFGPTITGNGTHNPPIWANGKRCYDEASHNTDTAATRLSASWTYLGQYVDVYDMTFYLARGL